jgi:hypothetical protein
MFREDDSRTWPLPKDGLWRQCTLRDVVESGQRLWLICNACHRDRYIETLEWIERHGLQAQLDTPLLLLARRVVCQRCNCRAVQIRPEPYSNLPRRDERQSLIATNYTGITCPVCQSTALACFGTRQTWDPSRPGFLPCTPLAECECLDCGNWVVAAAGLDAGKRSALTVVLVMAVPPTPMLKPLAESAARSAQAAVTLQQLRVACVGRATRTSIGARRLHLAGRAQASCRRRHRSGQHA